VAVNPDALLVEQSPVYASDTSIPREIEYFLDCFDGES
jgi:hypothetical protein